MQARLSPAALTLMVGLLAAAPAHAWRGSDEIVVRSAPPGAEVYVEDQFVGTTPLTLPVPCNEVVDRRYRIQFRDCDPVEGILSAGVAPGRVVGMVFSLGITAIFQCPNYFVPVNVALTGGSCATPVCEPQRSGEPSGDLAEQLKILKDLHARGVLTDAEYQRERDKALNGL